MARKSKAPIVETTEVEQEVIQPTTVAPAVEVVEVIQVQSELDTTSKEPEVIQEAPVITEDVPVALSQPEVELGFAARYKTPEYTITKQGGLTFFDLPTK